MRNFNQFYLTMRLSIVSNTILIYFIDLNFIYQCILFCFSDDDAQVSAVWFTPHMKSSFLLLRVPANALHRWLAFWVAAFCFITASHPVWQQNQNRFLFTSTNMAAISQTRFQLNVPKNVDAPSLWENFEFWTVANSCASTTDISGNVLVYIVQGFFEECHTSFYIMCRYYWTILSNGKLVQSIILSLYLYA